MPWVVVGAEADLGLTHFATGAVASIGLIGGVLGSFLGGVLGDVWGRRPTLIAAVAVAVISNALTAVGYHWVALATARFFQGVGTSIIAWMSKVSNSL